MKEGRVFRGSWGPAGRFAEELVQELNREVRPLHPLFGKKVVAVARCCHCDDVLFEVTDASPRFAVVHLTWKRECDSDERWPLTQFFSTWDQCMEQADH